MGEIKKFKSSAVKNIFLHVQRKQNDGHNHKNENIVLYPINYKLIKRQDKDLLYICQ